MTMSPDIDAAFDFIRQQTDLTPATGIILGTGLGGLVNDLDIEQAIDYETIPGFPVSTVETHSGRLLFGRLGGQTVAAMQGRFHYYEGYSMQQLAFPLRVMKKLGVERLFISNACGAMNPQYRKGDVMIIEDHINLIGDNPLIGPNDETLGPRFPDMCEPYSRRLIEIAEAVALEQRIKLQKGVYVAVAGPNLETRAEYRFLRIIGADVVGMSTVPEVIAARHLNMEVFGISIVTDECFPEALQPVNIQDIIATAMAAEPQMTTILKGVVAAVGS